MILKLEIEERLYDELKISAEVAEVSVSERLFQIVKKALDEEKSEMFDDFAHIIEGMSKGKRGGKND